MFGIMKSEENLDSYQSNESRKHYCAVCKTIAVDYGQKSRLLLNYDAVFLAELLSTLSLVNSESWNKSLQNANKCFDLPSRSLILPIPLRYAAAVNLVFAHYKIKDNYRDENKAWGFLSMLYNSKFKKSQNALREWGLDVDKIENLAKKQQIVEKTAPSEFLDFQSYLGACSNPAAEICAEIFAISAKLISRPELSENLRNFGFQFGKLVYISDAYQDLETDRQKHSFNPYLAFFGNEAEIKRNEQLQNLEQLVWDCQELLCQLPMEEEIKSIFSVRLMTNFMNQISEVKKSKNKFSLKEKIQYRFNEAKNKADAYCLGSSGISALVRYNLIFLAVFFNPQSAERNSLFTFILTFAGTLGLGWLVSVLPISKDRKRKKRRAKSRIDCSDRFRKIGECIIFIFIIFLIILLVEVALVILGIFLIIAGHIFWGIFSMLFFPIILLVIHLLWSYQDRKKNMY